MGLAKYFEDINIKLKELHSSMAELSSPHNASHLSIPQMERQREKQKGKIENDIKKMKKELADAARKVEEFMSILTDPAFEAVDAVRTSLLQTEEERRKRVEMEKRLRSKSRQVQEIEVERSSLKRKVGDLEKRLSLMEATRPSVSTSNAEVECEAMKARVAELLMTIEKKNRRIKTLQEILNNRASGG